MLSTCSPFGELPPLPPICKNLHILFDLFEINRLFAYIAIFCLWNSIYFYREFREKMKIPIDPLPESELCPYEKLRENNIKERLEAMRKCGFFEDLDSCKKDIGLTNDKKL